MGALRLCGVVPVRAIVFLLALSGAVAEAAPTSARNRLSTLSQSNVESGGPDFYFSLPNPSGAGNCIFFGLSYAYAAGRTVTIRDYGTMADATANTNVRDTWSGTPDVSVHDAGLRVTTSIFRLTNAAGGGQVFRVTFDTALQSVQAVIDEWYNVDPVAGSDGTTSNNRSSLPTVTAGSVTPATDGDLIWNYAVDVGSLTGGGVGGTVTSMTAGTNFTRKTADYSFGTFVQTYVQPSHAAITPTFTSSGTSTDGYNSLAVAVKGASAGTAPSATAIRVAHIQHTRDTQSLGSWTTGFPSEGTLLAFVSSAGAQRITSVTDTNGNSYAFVSAGLSPSISYKVGATSGSTLDVTIHIGAGDDLEGLLFDVINGGAFDTSATASGSVAGNADITNAPDITPSTSNGLVLSTTAFGTGPPSGSIGTGYVFDSVWYTGQSGASSGFTNGAGYQHIYNPNTSRLAFGYHTANGGASSGWTALAVAFKGTPLTPLSLTGLTPSSGAVGTSVTITGTNFGTTQGTSTVTFNGTTAAPTSWSATSIIVPVPTAATTGPVVATVGGVPSNGLTFTVTVPAPTLTSLTPASGAVGTSVTIAGANFGTTQGTSTVAFNGTTAAPTSWSATSIIVPVPTAATTGPVVATVGGVASNGLTFTVTVPAPTLTSLTPASGAVGTSVTIAGANFGTTQGTSTVAFNGTTATPTSWSATSIIVPVPTAATTGPVVATVGGVASNGLTFTVTVPAPTLTSLTPASGAVGTSVTITGTNFGTTQGTSTVTFNGTTATPTSWSATSIIVPVPTAATTGPVVATVGGVASNGLTFTVTAPAPTLTSLTPASGAVGTSVTIAGANFGTTQGTSTVAFNGTTAAPTSWSATSIIVPVPTAATTGPVVATVGGVASNGLTFTVTVPAPTLTSLTPASGAVGTSVTIAGANFGTTQGTSTVTFNGTTAAPTSWSATSIIVPVPTAATTGPVVATVGGVASNGISFTVTVSEATPISAQNRLSTLSQSNVESGGPDFYFSLPNPSGAGNCIFFGLSYAYAAGRTVTIRDYGTMADATANTNVRDTWSGTPDVSVHDAGLRVTTSIFRLTNAAGGGQVFRVTFDTALQSVQAVIDEWYNVDPVAGSDGTTSNNRSSLPTVTAGSVTPATDGDLIWNYAVDVGSLTGGGVGGTVTSMTAGTNFTRKTADYSFGTFVQTYVQPSHAAITPTFTSSGTSTDGYNSLAVAVKGASAGTAPSATAIRVAHIQHTRDTQSLGSWTTGFPSEGTLLAFVSSAGAQRITSVTDTNGNSYAFVSAGLSPSISYKVGATSGSTLDVTIHIGAGDDLEGLLFDVINGGAFDTSATASGSVAGNADITNAPDITPSTSNGLVLSTTAFGTGPPSGSIGTGYVFDSVWYTGQSGASSGFTNGAGYQHIYNPNTSRLAFGYHTANGGASSGWTALAVAFKGTPLTPLSLTGLTPSSGAVGTSVTITGTNFGTTQGTSTVTFNGTTATPTSWSATSIIVPVPTAATTGPVVATVGGVASNGLTFTVTVPAPTLTSLTPASGAVGTSVTIAGANFGTTQGTSTVTFNGTTAAPASWSATSIIVPVPTAATTGPVVATVGGVPSNGLTFTVTAPAPTLTSLTPASGAVGTSVTIAGANFGTTQGTSTVAFNGTTAAPTSWSATSIIVPVPTAATTGPVVATVGGVPSNGLTFTVTVPAPTLTSLTPASGAVGTSVTIAGANFGTTQGTSTVAFNGTTAAPTSWSATSIIVPVPTAATTGPVVATVGGVASNGLTFTVTVPAPTLTSLTPASGAVGTSVTIAGANFGTTQGTSTVAFNGTTATPTSWSATSIIVPVPTAATTGPVVATVGGVASNGLTFTVTVPAPTLTSLTPASGAVGTSVTITGTNFGTTQGTSTVTFNGTTATPTSWSATSIIVPVPTAATTGPVVATVGGVASNGLTFTVTAPAPTLTSLTPASGAVGTSVTIAGANFGTTQGTSTVTFNGTTAAPASWSATSIIVPVPTAATTGPVVATVGGVPSNGLTFTVTAPAPTLTSLTPASGAVGTSVTIAGANFGRTQGTSTVTFNGTTATPTSWSATSIIVPVPTAATTGPVVATVGGVASNGLTFTVTVPAPTLTSLTPASGAVGTSVTIAGANFGTTQGTSTVTFNGTTAAPTSWSATSIIVPVPTAATTGPVVATVGGVASNGISFTVTVSEATPISAQNRLSTLSQSNVESGGPDFYFSLPNPSGAGNCIFFGLSYAYAAGRTVTIRDYGTMADATANTNVRDTWSGTPDVSVHDAGLRVTTSIFRLTNAAGGGQVFRVTFDTALQSVQAVIDEWYNVDPVAGSDGTTSNNRSSLPTVTAGSVTPATDGDLIWNYAVDVGSLTGGGVGGTVTSMTAGTNFTRKTADYSFGTFVQTYVQPSHAAITPTFTSSGTSTDGYNSLAVAVKGASAGTAPSATAIRVAHIQHTRDTQSLGSWTTGFPSEGTLLAFVSSAGAQRITSVTDTNGNSYAFVSDGLSPSISYNVGATSGSTLDVTIHLGDGDELEGLLFDVINAGAFDTSATANGSVAGNADITDAPDITPSTSNGLVLSTTTFGTGPPSGSIGTGYVFDSVWYTGQSDASSGFTSGDGYQHIYNPNTSRLAFGYHTANGGASSGWAALAVAFKGTPLTPLSLTGLTPSSGAVGTSVTITGTNFGTTQGTSIATVGGVPSNGISFTVNEPPTLTQPANRTSPGNATVSMQLVASDPDGDALTYSATGLPAQLTVNAATGLISGTLASTSIGTYTVTATVSDGTLSASQTFTWTVTNETPVLSDLDFDGDGKTDVAVYRPSSGTWEILQSTTNYTTSVAFAWGISTDLPVPGDYDGDGKTDVAVYRPSNGTWYILLSGTNYTTSLTIAWGRQGDIPVPGDYDGDGKTDLGVYRPSSGTWNILESSTNYATSVTYAWGTSTDRPVPGDYDGDGKTDLAIYHPSTGRWRILLSGTNYTTSAVYTWGTSTDITVPGDYDGDGKTDLAVYRPSTGTWYVLLSSTNYTTNRIVAWGSSTAVPVVGDYDGDGEGDLAVFESGVWQILLSSSNYTTSMNISWGLSTDVALPKHP